MSEQATEAIVQLPLDRIRPNPHNPRTRFSGPEFDAFVANIEAVGVLSPILVRPAPKKRPGTDHEVVFGGRRLAACLAIAEKNGGPAGHTIPCRVRELTNAEALDLMVVENLQRDDLTPLEEANQFNLYVRQHGPEVVEDLAQRVGCSPAYIRRRLMIQTLPKKILDAWDRGEVRIGHLEQLARLKDKSAIAEAFSWVVDSGFSVGALRRRIEGTAPRLAAAKFDLEAAGCASCQQCSDAQKSLFDLPAPDKACCLDRRCFKQHQNNHLLVSWKRSGHRRKFKTNGFRFEEDVQRNQYESFAYRWDPPIDPPAKCRQCAEFITIIDLDGDVEVGQACLGPSECFRGAKAEAQRRQREKEKAKTPGAGNSGNPDPDKPRIEWHGTFFREEFYKTRLPEVIARRDPASAEVGRLALFCLVAANKSIHGDFARRHNLVGPDHTKAAADGWYFCPHADIWRVVSGLTRAQVDVEIRAAAAAAIMSSDYHSSDRRAVADHFEIDLASEWRPTADYLQKKTKAELLAIIDAFGILDRQPKASDGLSDDERALVAAVEDGTPAEEIKQRFGFASTSELKIAYAAALSSKKTAGPVNPKTMKKPELIQLFLAPGVDLAGVVPAEILAD